MVALGIGENADAQGVLGAVQNPGRYGGRMTLSQATKEASYGKFNSDPDAVVEQLHPGGQVIGLTMGQWSLIDLLHSILKKTGPADVVIATWSAGIKDAHQVAWMRDTGLIQSIQLLTDYSYQLRQPRYAVGVEELFGRENIRCSNLHAKFLTVSNESWKISVMTSMNLNANKKAELFQIVDDRELFDFLSDFANHHVQNMPPGWIRSGRTASVSVGLFFGVDLEKEEHWSDGFEND